MEETLVTSAVDLSGRMAFVYKVQFPTQKIGDFDTELVQEFWTARFVERSHEPASVAPSRHQQPSHF